MAADTGSTVDGLDRGLPEMSNRLPPPPPAAATGMMKSFGRIT